MNMIIWKVKNQIVKMIYGQLILQQRHLMNFNWETWYIVEFFFKGCNLDFESSSIDEIKKL
jgi:hypothetical protein